MNSEDALFFAMCLNDIIYEVYGGIDFAELPDILFRGIKNAKILYPAITRVFETYLGEPYGEKSHNQQFISDLLF